MVAVESTEGELPAGTQVLRRYSIVGKLAQGGMAEVYLARQVGPAGYQKLVVIKRVRPHLANDSDFVGMFVNEARLAAMINHPNVVQIFDLGDEPRPPAQGGGQDWFLAMEYLDGRDMLQVGRACRSHNKAVPFDVTARIIADACAGLDHAHNLKGEGNKSLDLVHRDMSPENILITFEGQVKVVDFGIAKASDNLIKTQAGQIKGKLGYVAPEAILGKPVDARADVFAVGATLYLFLSGRPAFSGTNPMEIFERSLKPPVPPREVNPRVPEALDAICMKALAQDREKRYRSAGEVRIALDAYLQSTGRPLGSVQLSQFMRILFPSDKDPVRHRIDKMLADAPIPASLPLSASMAANRPAGLAPAPAPIMVDDDKTNIVPSKEVMSVPEPITMQTQRPAPRPASAGPAHLRSMGVPRDPSAPSGRPVDHADMTNEDIDLRTLAARKGDPDNAATLQSAQPSAVPSVPSIDVSELDAIAAAVSEDDDMDIDMSTAPVAAPQLPPMPGPMPTEARRFQASMDAAAAAFDPAAKTQSGGDMPPPPLEPSGRVTRPPPAKGPPPQAFAPEPAPPSFEMAPPPAFVPAPPVVDVAPLPAQQLPSSSSSSSSSSSGPGLGLKLAMLGFGGLSGVIVLLLVLWVSGGLARIFAN
ncbi:MAG: serine/threonine-protein kinase [Deltaproteobacteria bacterium]|nr:serine/threonine-protein kinase [Deltaproteobacteria bacterium]